jgi:hypothetical protein
MATQSRNKTADLVVHGDAGSFKQEIIAASIAFSLTNR